jgi:hypothetical protein
VGNRQDQFITAICLAPAICEFSKAIDTSVNSFEASYVTDRRDQVYSLIVQCVPPNATTVTTTGEFTVTFTNPGLFFFRFLEPGQRNSAYFRFSFSLLWIVVFLIWIILNLIYRIQKSRLHYLISSIGATRILYLSTSFAYNIYLGINGRLDNWAIVHFPDLLVGVNIFLLFTFLALISKGYTVMRLYLSPLEIRSIVFVGVSVGIGEALFSYTGSSILLIVFTTTAYIYLFLQMRMHLESYALYVSKIESENSDERPEIRLMETGRVARPAWRFTSLTSVLHNATRYYEPLPDAVGLNYRLEEKWDLIGPYKVYFEFANCIRRECG